MAVEQLRRLVPGGIGAYARGLLGGLAQCEAEGADVDLTLLASRAPGPRPRASRPGGRPAGPFRQATRSSSSLPGPIMTRSWDHGLSHAPEGFDIVHSVSLAAPMLRRRARAGRSSLSTTSPGAAMPRPRPGGGAVARGGVGQGPRLRGRTVVTSKLVAADLASLGVARAASPSCTGGAIISCPTSRPSTRCSQRVGVSGEFLLTVSTLEPRKNVDRLVQAFGRARPVLARPWQLVIVGPAGWGPEPVRPPVERRRRLRGRPSRPGAHRALPPRPGLCLRSA